MQNFVLVVIVEKMWIQCSYNLYWKKLYEYIDFCIVDNWCDDYDQIFKVLICKDFYVVKLVMWQYLENIKIMLFNEISDDFEFNVDCYLFVENLVVYFDIVISGSK